MSGVQTLSSQNFVLFELFKFFTFLLGFWYGKCVFEKGSVSKTPQGGGVQKLGGIQKRSWSNFFQLKLVKFLS